MEKVLVIGPFNEAMKRALETSFDDHFSLEYITSREEYGRMADADYIILRTLDLNADDIAAMKKVKLIQRWGAGYDTVDIKAAAEKKIPVAITYGINATPVAEMTLALALAVYRNLIPMTAGIQDGRWERETYAKTSYTIQGKTVGIVGIGNIGRKAAALFQAFGAKVLYYDLFRLNAGREKELNLTYSELDSLWGKCDIISLHAPATPETAHIVNAASLNRMKDGAVLINTAREELVDMEALAAALSEGKLLGAGLDAVEEETMKALPFRGLGNVVLSAHLGGNTADNAVHMARRCAEQVAVVSAGGKLPPPHAVNLDLMERS